MTENCQVCVHNRPYQDEDPRNFESLETRYFGGQYAFKCKFCGRIETMDLFSEEGQKFINEFDALALAERKTQENGFLGDQEIGLCKAIGIVAITMIIIMAAFIKK